MLVLSVSNFEQWRIAARPLLTNGVAPTAIEWGDTWTLRSAGGADAVSARDPANADPYPNTVPQGRPLHISASLNNLLQTLSCFRDAGRWELMYRLVWRTLNGNRHLLDDAADPDVHNASLMQRAVNRDVHKMHAYVRFREMTNAAGESVYFAWFEPQHEILRRGAAFFTRRFPNMQWTLATPDGAATWKPRELNFVDSPSPAERPSSDVLEDLWRIYYRSICNVTRINPAAMQREMPQRYWRHLPEAGEIEALIRNGASNFMKQQHESPEENSIMPKAVKRALPNPAAEGEVPQTCRRCDLWKQATQAVQGEGDPRAKIMLVGEQPGDEEDLRGHPFVGPAGKVLDQAIAAVGLDRDRLFITNAVKHFKWEPRGKRRLHKKPGAGEINACNIWLEREITAVRPTVIVALGASALRALTGASSSIDAARQQDLRHPSGARILSTYHPSAILRAEGDRIAELRGHLENDLRTAGLLGQEAD